MNLIQWLCNSETGWEWKFLSEYEIKYGGMCLDLVQQSNSHLKKKAMVKQFSLLAYNSFVKEDAVAHLWKWNIYNTVIHMRILWCWEQDTNIKGNFTASLFHGLSHLWKYKLGICWDVFPVRTQQYILIFNLRCQSHGF